MLCLKIVVVLMIIFLLRRRVNVREQKVRWIGRLRKARDDVGGGLNEIRG